MQKYDWLPLKIWSRVQLIYWTGLIELDCLDRSNKFSPISPIVNTGFKYVLTYISVWYFAIFGNTKNCNDRRHFALHVDFIG